MLIADDNNPITRNIIKKLLLGTGIRRMCDFVYEVSTLLEIMKSRKCCLKRVRFQIIRMEGGSPKDVSAAVI
jgi:hypothetical protein